jgi:hypothetical protein
VLSGVRFEICRVIVRFRGHSTATNRRAGRFATDNHSIGTRLAFPSIHKRFALSRLQEKRGGAITGRMIPRSWIVPAATLKRRPLL